MKPIPYQPNETIAGIATPPGEGGVAIVRISGKEARDVADRVFSGPVHTYKTHTAHYGYVVDKAGHRVDDVLLLTLLGTRSYTGEDTIEIQCHGGSFVTLRILDCVLQAGARMARPGEFTFKALMNGKIDLVQAEAVQELICAKNEWALNAARNQLEGRLSQKIQHFQTELTSLAAVLEAWIDFPDEDLDSFNGDATCKKLETICQKMQQLAATYEDGKVVKDGISLCLIGSPNVGKSTLMNTLLDKDRAIVTHVPGTTRDILEDQFRLNGLHFRLIDTAGIRKGTDLIEQEGIRRSKQALKEADFILLVLDASMGILEQDIDLMQKIPKQKTIVVWNKIDLSHNGLPVLDFPYSVSISAKKNIGIAALQQTIDKMVWNHGPPSSEEILMTNVRHQEALLEAIQACQDIVNGLKNNLSPELLTVDMRHSLSSLGKIIGTDVTENILSAIFSQFCIGK